MNLLKEKQPLQEERLDTKSSELFPTHLPPWITRSVGRLIVILFFAALIGSIVFRIPEKVRCPFVLMPVNGADPIQSPVRGIVEQNNIVEGRYVQKDEPLFIIRSQEIHDRVSEMSGLEHELTGDQKQEMGLKGEIMAQKQADEAELQRLTLRVNHFVKELQKARELQEISKERYQTSVGMQRLEIEQSQNEWTFRKNYRENYQDLLQRMEKLKEKEVISHLEILRFRLDHSKAALDADLAERKLNMAKLQLRQMEANRNKELTDETLQIQRLESEHKQNLAALEKLRQEAKARESAFSERQVSLSTKMEKAKVRIKGLQRELRDSEGDLMVIKSPFGGTVLRVARKNVGDVIEHGQELCQIARIDKELRVELKIPEEAVAKLQTNQPVKLLLNAFPYERYGARQAVIQWISPAVVITSEGKYFQAFAELRNKTITVAGVAQPLRAGMQGEAQVIVGRRALIQYVFDPLRRLRESVADIQPKPPSK